MRDPKRIYRTTSAIANAWADLPDWRFGQLMYNFKAHMDKQGIDIFFLEEDRFVEYLREYVNQFKL